MKRCVKCNMPDTRPGSVFKGDVCQACFNYEQRAGVDWKARLGELGYLCHHMKKLERKYDCLIPVSGGKDSHMLCKVMVEDMGMRPLLVTVNDSFTHTRAGTDNLRNLITRYGNHLEYTIQHSLFKKATRWAFEETGEPLKFVEYAIYTVPYMIAQVLAIPLVVFGENSAYEYGSTERDNPDATLAIDAIVNKISRERAFWLNSGLSNSDIDSILPNPKGHKPHVIFMSYYVPWSSTANLKVAKERGFKDLDDTKEWQRQGTCEQFEQIDSIAYLVHLYLKYPKFGFQRAADIASRRVREGLMTLEEAKKIMEEVDPVLDPLSLMDFCYSMGYTEKEFWHIAKKFDKMGVVKDED